MNWGLILFRAFAAPALLIVGSGLAVGGIGDFEDAMQVYMPYVLVVPVGILAWALCSFCIACYRLLAWEKGTVPICRHCGGPLGGSREGKKVYGKRLSDYRACLNCGGNTPEY